MFYGLVVGEHAYDVVIHGANLGGLLAASLLGRDQLRVALIDSSGRAASSYKVGHYSLPLEPLVLRSSSRFVNDSILGLLGRTTSHIPTLGEPALDFVLPNLRFRWLRGDLGANTDEVEAFFGSDASTIEQALGLLRASNKDFEQWLSESTGATKKGKRARQVLRKLVRDFGYDSEQDQVSETLAVLPVKHPLRWIMRMLVEMGSNNASSNAAMFSANRLVSNCLLGAPGQEKKTYDLWGQSLRTPLTNFAQRVGVELFYPEQVEEIERGKNKGYHFVLGGSGRKIYSDIFVATAPMVGPFAGVQQKAYWTHLRPERIRVKVSLVVNKGVFSPLMALQGYASGVPHLGTLLFRRFDPDVEECEGLELNLMLPYEQFFEDREYRYAVRDWAIAFAETLGPNLRSHLRCVDCVNDGRPPEGVEASNEFALEKLPQWARGPSLSSAVFAFPFSSPRAGFRGVPLTPGREDFFQAGVLSYPELGEEGEVLAALDLHSQIMSRYRFSRVLRRGRAGFLSG